MQLLKFLPLAFVAFASASPLLKRDAALVAQDVNDVMAKAQTLDASVTAYKGGNDFISALKIQSQSSDLEKALNKTTTDANASAPWDNEESATVGLAVLDLQPVVIQLLDNIKSKKAAFDSGFIPLSFVVLSSLKSQRAATVKVSDAITAKLSDLYKEVAPEIVNPILAKFDEVIKAYQPSFGFPSA